VNVDQEFPKRFITSMDVDAAARPVKLRIVSCKLDTIGQGRNAQRKIVLGFAGTVKELALNAANRATMATALGAETDDWLHAVVTLGCVDATFEGKAVRSVRIVDVMDGVTARALAKETHARLRAGEFPAGDPYAAERALQAGSAIDFGPVNGTPGL
jgi:hypothetical protein